MFQIENATFAVPERTLLHGITVSFEANKVYGLIGHNGSGKSTLLKLLTRQHRPASGRILLDGRDIQSYSARSYARQTAYLPQYLPSATALKAEELVAMGRYAWSGLLGRASEADRQAVAEALRLTHTENFTGQIVAPSPAANARASGWRCAWRSRAASCCWTSRWPRWTSPTRSK